MTGATTAARVETLLASMTLAQKVGQMVQAERMAISPAEVRDWHIGSVLSGGGSCPGDNRPADWVAMNDAYWEASMAPGPGRLAIPIIYGVDAIHGNNNVRGATVFPHNIGLGAARDAGLIQRVASVTAREILACGVDWTFAPTLAVAQDLRWGRSYESYSSDPELVGRYAAAFVAGMQGDLGRDGVVATAKHWVGDGGTEHGIEQGDTRCDEATLAAVHMAPYRAAIGAGALSVMASFNSWNGDKCHGHGYLIDHVLKGQFGFHGCVVSDWDGIDYLADNYFDAIALGVNAGIDMFMISEHWQPFIGHLIAHARRGTVAMARIDDAVRRILGMKLAAGLFGKPRPAERHWSNHPSFGCADHRAVAREAVRKSLVALKNDGGLLPLARDARILVAGKNAHDLGHQCGGFTIDWQGTSGNDAIVGGTSVWQGIQAVAPQAVLDPAGDTAAAGRYDLAIAVIGERPYAEGMGDIRSGDDVIVQTGSRVRGALKVLEPYGAGNVLAQLHPEDLAVIQRLNAAGLPVVTVMISGRPLVTDLELAASRAFVAAWLPGSEGAGVADVLFGTAPFTGKLPFPWPSAHGVMPAGA